MKLPISPQFCAVRAARRKALYEVSSTHHSPSLELSQCRTALRSFSSSTSKHSKHIEQKELESTTPKSESSLSHQIRLLMRRIPHPVAIITAYASSSSPSTSSSSTQIPRGMTVSSFNTVTLHPKPIITFNVRQPSETLSALQSSGRFLVHLLSPTSSMARLAHNFSRGNANLELERFAFVDYDIETTNINDNDNTSTTTTTTRLPRLVQTQMQAQPNNKNNNNEASDEDNTTDFTFILECKYLPDKSVQVYDHMIVLGTVERVLSATPSDSTDAKRHAKEDFSLMYADTRFWKMGEEV